MSNKTSPHILSSAANLLGFCLFVITSFHVTNRAEESVIDEFTSFIGLLLAVSCALSFLSLRTENPVREKRLEIVADYLFFSSLLGILLIILFIILRVLK